MREMTTRNRTVDRELFVLGFGTALVSGGAAILMLVMYRALPVAMVLAVVVVVGVLTGAFSVGRSR